jgi:hypothetical protein
MVTTPPGLLIIAIMRSSDEAILLVVANAKGWKQQLEYDMF